MTDVIDQSLGPNQDDLDMALLQSSEAHVFSRRLSCLKSNIRIVSRERLVNLYANPQYVSPRYSGGNLGTLGKPQSLGVGIRLPMCQRNEPSVILESRAVIKGLVTVSPPQGAIQGLPRDTAM